MGLRSSNDPDKKVKIAFSDRNKGHDFMKLTGELVF
jgi:hypothetical protein